MAGSDIRDQVGGRREHPLEEVKGCVQRANRVGWESDRMWNSNFDPAQAEPARLFERLAGEPGAFWIDAGDGTDAFLSAWPDARLSIERGGQVKLEDGGRHRTLADDPLAALERFVSEGTSAAPAGRAPRVVGALAYDLGPSIEPRMRLARGAGDGLPLAVLARYPAVAVCRRERPDAAWSVHVEADRPEAAERLVAALRAPASARPVAQAASVLTESPDREEYLRAVARAQELIARGDLYQVNLAQRFVVDDVADPARIFLRLREVQPMARGCFLDAGGFTLLSNSPERFLRVRDDGIETEPIKGTRPRGASAPEDDAQRHDLTSDTKERAEHVMIVDLERNDLGRVCRSGSVTVPSLMRVESFATLHHMVSTVRGRLRPEVGLADLLRATFPGGSVTGAPKIRATQVIAELEAGPRGFYTGALLWFRGPRDFDSNIAIRTAVVRDGRLVHSVGAGIVADSDAEREVRECRLKAAPLLRAAGLSDDAVAVRRSPANAGLASPVVEGHGTEPSR